MDVSSERMAVVLVAQSPTWTAQAEQESARLAAAIGDTLVVVHHIGSTAIPGILAKPIVDLIPVVTDLPALDAREEAVRALGYRWHGEFGLGGRRYCTLSDLVTGKRTFQLHCYAEGAEGLLLQNPGPKADYRRTDQVVRLVIRCRFLDPDSSPAVIAQKIRQQNLANSTRSVERIIADFGLQKKTLRTQPG